MKGGHIQLAQRRRAAFKSAQKLFTLGMEIIVTDDKGQDVYTTLAELPSTDRNGNWIARAVDIRGEVGCERIRPAGKVVQS